MRHKVNTWPGWNGNTRYPRLRSTAGWWPVTVVYRGCSPRVKRGSPRLVRGETRRCRAVSILYQYEIQTDGLGVKGTERAGANRAVRFCAPFGHQGNRTRPRNPLWFGGEKCEKSRSDVKRQGNLRSTTNRCCIWLTVTAMSNYYSVPIGGFNLYIFILLFVLLRYISHC